MPRRTITIRMGKTSEAGSDLKLGSEICIFSKGFTKRLYNSIRMTEKHLSQRGKIALFMLGSHFYLGDKDFKAPASFALRKQLIEFLCYLQLTTI